MDRQGELETFVAVVRHGGFSAAARALGLTPSALSKQIGRLEDRLGVTLLRRNTRGVTLTDVGQTYFERGQPLVEQLHDLDDAVAGHRDTPQGVVRVSLPPGLARFVVVDMLPPLRRRHPELRVVFELSDGYVDLVQQGIDVAVRVGTLADSSLVARKIATFSRLVVAAPSYLEEHGTPEHPADLARHNCLTLGVNQRTMNRWELVGPDGPELIEVTGSFEANTMEALYDAAVAGLGVARLSPLLLRRALPEGTLTPLLRDYVLPNRTAMHVVFPAARHPSAAARAFIDALVEYLRSAARDSGLTTPGRR